jgi:N-acetylglutamate synthase-like GNAT family acetyltransferase
VRRAIASDAPAFAALQRAAWLAVLGQDLPGLAEALDPAGLTSTWAQAISLASGADQYAVYSALADDGQVAGFAALAPSLDPDSRGQSGELVALWVSPAHQRAGHGSRLLAAVAESARSSTLPFQHLSHWVTRQDIHRQRFLRGAGFGADGAERTWRAPPGQLVDEQRWSALLS